MAGLLRTILPLLALCLVFAGIASALAPNERIEKACKQAPAHYDLCVEALSSDPSSYTARNLHDLAKISLRLTSKNATETCGEISDILGKNITEPGLQQTLVDCFDEYLEAVDQLIDAQPALDDRDYKEVYEWVQAALHDAKSCQESCKKLPVHKNILTKKNADVQKLCSITLSLVKALESKTQIDF